MRNVIKQAKRGRATIKKNQELSVRELEEIFNIYDTTTARTGKHLEGLWDAVSIAYYMGYAVGSKQS